MTSLKQQTFDQSRDEILLKAIDKLTATVFVLVILFAIANVTILLILGGHAAQTDISDDHTYGELPVLSQ